MDKRKLMAAIVIENRHHRKANIELNRIISTITHLCDDIYEEMEQDNEMEMALFALIRDYENAPQPQLQPQLTITDFYNTTTVDKFTTMEFQLCFRISRQAFDYLHRKFVVYSVNLWTRIDDDRIHNIPIEKQLLSAIYFFVSSDSHSLISQRFKIAESSFSDVVVRVVDFMNTIYSQLVCFPNADEKQIIKNNFMANKEIPGVIGVLGSTYISCTVPAQHLAEYLTTDNYTAVALQAICDGQMKFIDCFVGYPNAARDNALFENSLFYHKVQDDTQEYFEGEEYILTEKSYPDQMWCRSPFHGKLLNTQRVFNENHKACREVIKRSFALLFGRCRRLRHLDLKQMDVLPNTVLAVCAMHNVCLKYSDPNQNVFVDEGMPFANRFLIREVENNTTMNASRKPVRR